MNTPDVSLHSSRASVGDLNFDRPWGRERASNELRETTNAERASNELRETTNAERASNELKETTNEADRSEST